MSSGLLALLDDIAAIVKVTAASIDDVAVQALKASSKAAGVVIDDAAVTPKYVVGLSPKRELPIIWNIAKGSIKNKLLFLLPAMLLLGTFAPWSVAPLLAIGGAFLCFEGYEKLHHIVHGFFHKETHIDEEKIEIITPEELEKIRTSGAIRTDFILSAEIMAISYAVVATEPFLTQFFTLLVVAVAITAGVYGFVGLIVKMDDIGLHLAKDKFNRTTRAFGRGLIKGMPALLKVLAYIGTAAMLWVGGGIIIHAIPFLHHEMLHLVHELHLEGFAAWALEASLSLIFGIVIGFFVVQVVERTKKYWPKKSASSL